MTDQTLTLGAIKEAGQQRLLEAGLIEAVIEVTVSYPTWGSGLKTHTHLFRTTGRDCREAAAAAGIAAANVKLTRPGLKLSSQPILHRLNVQGAEVIHDLWNGEALLQRYAWKWVLVELIAPVITGISG